MMDRGEPALVPEWLKGVNVGGGGGTSQISQATLYKGDNGGTLSSRHRVLQQAAVGGVVQGELDIPHFSAALDRTSFTSLRRGLSSNDGSLTDRSLRETESSLQARVERNGDLDGEVDCDSHARNRGVLLGEGAERQREQERLEIGLSKWSIAGVANNYESDCYLSRSQSSGSSIKVHDSGLKKVYEMGNPVATASFAVNGGLAGNMQKAAFERNFPSLGSDEKQSSVISSIGLVPGGSPRPLWQVSCRPDVTQSLSPGSRLDVNRTLSLGLTTGLGKNSVVADGCSEVTVDPVKNVSLQNNSLLFNTPSLGMMNQMPTTASAPSLVSGNAMNMAEALALNSPRARTPTQLYVENQKWEELALKQSRQLIPVTPSLPKTMSLADKARPKLSSVSKLSQPTKASTLLSPHRALATEKYDSPKPAQGKLLVLKLNKEASVSNTVKADSTNPVQAISPVDNSGANGFGARRQKQLLDNRVLLPSTASCSISGDGPAQLRPRDGAIAIEERRPSAQAQNRSDFFNALRKKAAENGAVSFSFEKPCTRALKNEPVNLKAAGISEVTNSPEPAHFSQLAENETEVNSVQIFEDNVCGLHGNGDSKENSRSGNGYLFFEEVQVLDKEPAFIEFSNTCGGSSIMWGSEEEEAAFLRSLGWKEDAEGAEALTEEEINAFHQMRAKSSLNRGNDRSSDIGTQQCIGSLGSCSSGFSSDSESDDEPC
eukprot:c28287_g1_i2 orf=1434-3581(+)